MIIYSEIKVPKRFQGEEFSIGFHKIKIHYTVDKIEIFPLTSIINKEYKGTTLVFYDKQGSCRGADRADIGIVKFYKFIKQYFKD